MVKKKTTYEEQENMSFLKFTTNTEIAASAKQAVNLQTDRANFGNNFNTFIIVNAHATIALNVYLDGIKIGFIPAANSFLAISAEDGIWFNTLELENTSGAVAYTAAAAQITYGRTESKTKVEV